MFRTGYRSFIPNLGSRLCFGRNFRVIRAYTIGNSSRGAGSKSNTGLKGLMQTYGWSALGVYLALSAIDLPICFFGVHSMGEVNIKVYLNRLKNVAGFGKDEQQLREELELEMNQREIDKLNDSKKDQSILERVKNSNVLAEFVIAYGIHKSLAFIRIPITAAITPGLVRLLQSWGFNLGKMNKRSKPLYGTGKLMNKSGRADDFIKGTTAPKNHPPKH
ncbi:Nat2p Ecym_1419 [Eremothecium cymbalariae DBVPG|uniref:DUF1279 domain-containing protein n=1 Tax=Eremothecium cymbalariae (strain CBS 270.75 / DBVPG 7215 / KCTC 17166 / NRRL Y-17582) TaxID=931890 RepID=G8JM76_ERECY|nr:hypothetical protein Ecym_1419 [Eremothecium cymbalariae DBVPG\